MRADFWAFASMAAFMVFAAVVTTIVDAWPGPIITALAAVAFTVLARGFRKGQIAIYGSQLWQRVPLLGWLPPLDLERLEFVALVEDSQTRRLCLRLQSSENGGHAQAETTEPGLYLTAEPPGIYRTVAMLAVQDYSRRRLECFIAPWVLARPSVASTELAHALKLRMQHPRTAGLRILLSHEP
jgi:hypothetical protein